MKKMVYPMEEGLQLEVWMEWDDMVLPDLAKGYEHLIHVFRDLAMGGGRAWSVNPRTGKRESILEGLLPSDDDFRLAREIVATCKNAPDYIRCAPGLLGLAKRLCRVADWAVAGKKRTRAFIKRKAMEAWTQCERNAAFVEAEECAIMVQLRLLAELERTRAKLYRQQGDEQRAAASERRFEVIEERLSMVKEMKEKIDFLHDEEKRKSKKRSATAKENPRRGRDDQMEGYWDRFLRSLDKKLNPKGKHETQQAVIEAAIAAHNANSEHQITIGWESVKKRWQRWKKGKRRVR